MYFRIFDCWRFAAAILVMSYHFLFWAPGGGREGTDFLYRLLPLLDMFFMISGFFIATRYADRMRSPRDYLAFMRRRVARLYPLHFCCTMFFALVAVGAGLAGAKHYPWAEELAVLPQHLLVVHALGTTDSLRLNYVSWSVSAEFFSYLLFPLIVLAQRWKGFPAVVGLAAIWIAGLEIASREGVFPSGHWTSADNLGAYRAFADFAVGAVIAEIVRRRPIDIQSNAPGLALGVLAVSCMAFRIDPHVSLALIAASLTATALAETARPESTRHLAVLMPLTRVAFGIYLIHPIMEFVFLVVLWQRYLEPAGSVNFYVFWLLPMAASIAVALVSSRYLERPLGRLIAGSDHRARKQDPQAEQQVERAVAL